MKSSKKTCELSTSDATWKHSLREAAWILGIAAFFMVWTVGYSYLFGYGEDALIDLTWGMPTWVFWGIAVPWAAAVLVSIAFAIWFIEEDSLAEDSTSQGNGDHTHE